MDPTKEAALVKMLGPELTAKVLQAGGYDETETTKAAGMRTSYKASAAAPATSVLDEALDTLDDLLDDVVTDENEQTLADQLNTFTAQLQKQLSAPPAKPPTKLTDSGPQSLPPKAAKEKADPPYTSASPDQKRRTARTFLGWLGLDGPAKEEPAETQRKIYEDEDNFLGLGRLRGSRKP